LNGRNGKSLSEIMFYQNPREALGNGSTQSTYSFKIGPCDPIIIGVQIIWNESSQATHKHQNQPFRKLAQ
jgi:hypothetical protein